MSKTVTLMALFVVLFSPEAPAKWLWVQQQNFKQFDSQKIPTDLILLQFFDSAQMALQRPIVQRVHGINFREMAFEVPDTLNPLQVSTLVADVTSDIGTQLEHLGKNPFADTWSQWLLLGMRWGEGKTPEEAFIQMKLKSFGLASYEQWYTKTSLLRSQLQILAASKNVDWSTILEASRRYGRKKELMARWIQSQKLPAATGPLVSEYGFLLTLADYLNPAKFQSEKSALDRLAKEQWTQLLVIDVDGLATINRLEQDRWFSSGAKINMLSEVSKRGDEILTRMQDEITNEVVEKPHLYSGYYSVGDSFVIALQGDVVQENGIASLLHRLQRIRSIHNVIVSRSGTLLQETLAHAQQKLKSDCRQLLSRASGQ